MTSPRAVRARLISMASFIASPEAPLFFGLSEPARSQSRSLLVTDVRVSTSCISRTIVKKRWDLELSAFELVLATCLLSVPSSTALQRSVALSTSRSAKFSTKLSPVLASRRTSRREGVADMPPVAVVVEVDMFEAAPMFEEEAVIVVVPADIAAVLLPFAEVAVAVVAAVADVVAVEGAEEEEDEEELEPLLAKRSTSSFL
mmetsp:Transcript_61958/g.130837  ORF Transcript_61958/g.130837 Transcript_61958/m.130837 type:complete len:202 (+) Transcript_61958:257-862(+)